MTNPNETINAIPSVDEDGNHYVDKRNYGLTKMEYFTAMAMSGYCAHETIGNSDYENIAAHAVAQASAIIKELNRKS